MVWLLYVLILIFQRVGHLAELLQLLLGRDLILFIVRGIIG